MALRSGEGEPRRILGGDALGRVGRILGQVTGGEDSVPNGDQRNGKLDGKVRSEAEGPNISDILVREMNLEVKTEAVPYLNYLHALPNVGHFVRPPKTLHDLRKEVAEDRKKLVPTLHYLVAIQNEQIVEGGMVKKKKRVIGGGLIDDAAFGEGDSGLRLFVIDPNKQGKGLGERVYLETLLWAFLTPAHDGRHRIEVDFSVVLNEDAMLRVLREKDWKVLLVKEKFEGAINRLKAERHISTRMIMMGEKYGGKFLYGKPREATEVPGFVVPQPTARYEVRLDPFKDAIRRNQDLLKSLQARHLDFLAK